MDTLKAIAAIAATRRVNMDQEADMLESIKQLASCLTPTFHEGIEFYPCGSNASHHFSLGVKGGKLWKRSQRYDWWVDSEGEHEISEDKVYEVHPSTLYLGSH